MNKLKLILLTSAISLVGIYAYSIDVNIIDAGGIPDGKSLNTIVIQGAIDLVSGKGGGMVIIPAGRFVTGSIILKSGVTILIKKGGVLLGSENLGDYNDIQPKFIALRTGQPTKQLIFAEDQENIGLEGEGIIDGRGKAFSLNTANNEPGIQRPHLIQLIRCRNIKIEGLSLLNSGGWMQHYLACENLLINGINVYNHCNYNNDGLDIDGCHNVIVSNCIIDSDDDGICLKSTSPESCINVLVTSCLLKSHCNSLKIGTESTGGFQNITFSNCNISPTSDPIPLYGTKNGQSAISVEMVDGGILDGVNISNINISETDCPIFIRLGNRARKYSPGAPEPGVGVLRNVSISNILVSTSSKITSSITGIKGSCAEGIFLSNIIITNLSEGFREDTKIVLPENDKAYPTPAMFGDIIPASGFFVRHVKNINFNNVRISLAENNERPTFIFQDVKNGTIIHPVIETKNYKLKILEKDSYCEKVKLVK